MTRLRLFQIRLAATCGLLLLLVAVVRLLWFPDAYFAIFDVGKLLLILAVVALSAKASRISTGALSSGVLMRPGFQTSRLRPGHSGICSMRTPSAENGRDAGSHARAAARETTSSSRCAAGTMMRL